MGVARAVGTESKLRSASDRGPFAVRGRRAGRPASKSTRVGMQPGWPLLRLVPPWRDGDDTRELSGETPLVGIAGTSRAALAAVPPAESVVFDVPVAPRRGKPAPVRLTRRGRVVLIALLLGLSGGVVALLAPPTDAAPPAGPARTVVVRTGDTMWSIAERAIPDQAPYAAIREIERLNHLADATVYVGQQLTLPPA